MPGFSIGVALLAAVGIIVIGVMYVWRPRTAALSFGLPPPEPGPNIAWWLRLKGVRDIASGLIVLALVRWGDPRLLGVVLFIAALISACRHGADPRRTRVTDACFGIHGLTAVVMIAGALPLAIF